MKRNHRPAPQILALALVLGLQPLNLPAAEVLHYWDFDSLSEGNPVDVIGGVTTRASGGGDPDISVHPEYDEAYTGAGNSLNIELADTKFLIADVYDDATGSATALLLGGGDFAFSYWSYDASDLDGDDRAPRVFDALDGTTTGIQLASNAAGIFNYRMDDDDGGVIISNNILADITQPDGIWIHIAVNVSRTTNEAEIFFDGASQGAYDISMLTGDISPTMDMLIGVINGGGSAGPAQQAGLDDLAFYTGTLSGDDIAGLAAAVFIPSDISESGPRPLFEITEILAVQDGEISITWNSVPGANYAVETWSESASIWLELTDSEAADSLETTYTYTPFEFDRRALYRIKRLPSQ